MRLRPSLVALLLIATSCSSGGSKVPRPNFELVAPAGCQSFRGYGSGNDTTISVELYLCPRGSALKGEMLISGVESGWTVRALIGTVQPDASLALRDARIVEEGRAAGWMFCVDTEYTFSVTPDGSLRGGYSSEMCSDRATLLLLPQTSAASPPPASTGVSP